MFLQLPVSEATVILTDHPQDRTVLYIKIGSVVLFEDKLLQENFIYIVDMIGTKFFAR